MILRTISAASLILLACPGYTVVLNNPYPQEDKLKKIYYSSFSEQPKTLDPARSYAANEYLFIAQIYEPLLQYDYYKRPYQLAPLTAAVMPIVRFYNKKGMLVEPLSPEIDYSVYTIEIKKGLLYQPHPALARDDSNHYRYLDLPIDYFNNHDISELSDFKFTGTREVIADDYIYQIKRIASPAVGSSIFGLMSEHIFGLKAFAEALPASTNQWIDLRQYSLPGVKKIDNYTFEIRLNSSYAQFMFWLAMPFFSPIPWEVDKFYAQPGMEDNNLTFGWYPVGTGPFMLTQNNPNRQITLSKNPNFRYELFPNGGDSSDIQAGYAHGLNKTLPLIDTAVYTLEKESIPRWNKFLQGYYDLSGISADSFNQAISLDKTGEPVLSPAMQKKKLRLNKMIDLSIYYTGFNMLDPVVGGTSERARKLRQAISIAINYEENITLFFNGRGKAAHGPLPPGIFGFKSGQSGINPYVYFWENNTARRFSLKKARQLLAEAGYINGRDPETGERLILHYDIPVTGGPDDKSSLEWMRKQFAAIGIDLDIRATLYNRFQEKMRSGNAQIFSWGWSGDYPDPENFLFMLYGANGKVLHGGENASNYANQEYDRLFELMKNRPNDSTRLQLIDQMVELVRHDAPWVWGINTETFTLSQQWVEKAKPNTISLNQLKYIDVNVALRNQLQTRWNQARFLPIILLSIIILLTLLPLILFYRSKERRAVMRFKI